MKELKGIDAMEFKVGDHVNYVDSDRVTCVSAIKKLYRNTAEIANGIVKPLEELTLCLPEKWAIKTDRQEFYDWFNGVATTTGDEFIGPGGFVLFPARTDSDGEKFHCGWTAPSEEYITIRFEYWCRVHRPDLLSCSEIPTNSIPEKWCVRRTPKNAEVLNAWYKSKRPDKWLTSFDLYISNDLDFYHNPIVDYPEITYEQWQTIPEVVEWLKSSRFSEEETKRLDNLYSMYDVVSPHGLLLINQQRHFVVTNSEEKKLFSVSVQPKPVEEREIIGYELSDQSDSRKWEGLWTTYKFEIDGIKKYAYENKGNLHWHEKIGSVVFEKMITAGIFKPVYKEAPIFKGGDWVVYENVITKTFQILRVTELGLEGDIGMYAKRFCRFATPEEIEKATFRPVWERFPTWESLDIKEGWYTNTDFVSENTFNKDKDDFSTQKQAESALAFAQLSQIEKAWNERMKGFWTVKYDHGVGRLVVIEAEKFKAQITFHSEELAMKSLELHADLWRKFWMV